MIPAPPRISAPPHRESRPAASPAPARGPHPAANPGLEAHRPQLAPRLTTQTSPTLPPRHKRFPNGSTPVPPGLTRPPPVPRPRASSPAPASAGSRPCRHTGCSLRFLPLRCSPEPGPGSGPEPSTRRTAPLPRSGAVRPVRRPSRAQGEIPPVRRKLPNGTMGGLARVRARLGTWQGLHGYA